MFFKKYFVPFQSIWAYSEVQNIFASCDKNTLITFDVDDTIITTKDFIARDPNTIPWLFKLRALLKYPEIARSEKLRWVYSIMFQNTERFVLDQNIVPSIKQLQDKGVPIIALTFMPSGTVGITPHMPEWRANMLKSFGIDFSGTFGDTCFTSLPQDNGDYPCLYKGILCTNQVKKGTTLGAFLDYHKPNIDRIISLDSIMQHGRWITDQEVNDLL